MMSKINPIQAAALNDTTKPVENKTSPANKSAVKTSTSEAPAKPATKTSATKPVIKTTAAKPAAAKPVEKIAAPKTIPKKVEKVTKVVKEKTPKLKMERDSFTMPKAEYAQLYVLKERLIKLGQPSKKSELLRAGIMQLTAMTDAALKAALAKVPAIKTGRPKKK
jgi:hypothetical protein